MAKKQVVAQEEPTHGTPLKTHMLYIGYNVMRSGTIGDYEIAEDMKDLLEYQYVICVAAPLHPYWPRIINMYAEKE